MCCHHDKEPMEARVPVKLVTRNASDSCLVDHVSRLRLGAHSFTSLKPLQLLSSFDARIFLES